jgi:hypothetical protein
MDRRNGLQHRIGKHRLRAGGVGERNLGDVGAGREAGEQRKNRE